MERTRYSSGGHHGQSTSTVIDDPGDAAGINKISSFVTTVPFKPLQTSHIAHRGGDIDNQLAFNSHTDDGRLTIAQKQQAQYFTQPLSYYTISQSNVRGSSSSIIDSTGGSNPFKKTTKQQQITLERQRTNTTGKAVPQSTKHSSASTTRFFPQGTGKDPKAILKAMVDAQQHDTIQVVNKENIRFRSNYSNVAGGALALATNTSHLLAAQLSHSAIRGSDKQAKQGAQGSQKDEVPQHQAKVGATVPKTPTISQNMRSLTNLKQFNQIFNQKIQQKLQPVKPMARRTSQDEGENKTANSSQLRSFGIGYQTHLKQQLNTVKQSTKPLHKSQSTIHASAKNGLKDEYSTQGAGKQSPKLQNKTLRIAIPSNSPPRQTDLEKNTGVQPISQVVKSKSTVGPIVAVAQQCSSTKNQSNQQGSIKVQKVTCNSTRHDSAKQNIFSGKPKGNTGYLDNQPSTLAGNGDQAFPLQPAHKIVIPNHEPTKHSLKRNGLVRAYAANTNQGLVRNYNEDRVSIILNILKPASRTNITEEQWPRCSFFAIYDGHGGSACADFLRDNLHQYVINEDAFPSDPEQAIRQGFARAEKNYIDRESSGVTDKSGSCAIVIMIVEDTCYVANVGDSRAVLSSQEGRQITALSRDHKPSDEIERNRILEAGGQIYHRTSAPAISTNNQKKEGMIGPLRVLPGRLSVSRTFGDAEAKIPSLGGNPLVVIATPDITTFKIGHNSEHDFVVLGCDGIFDKMSNEDLVQCVWNSVSDNQTLRVASNVHKQSAMGVEYILKNSLLRRTLDNVTAVMISFNNFKRKVFGNGKNSARVEQSEEAGPPQGTKSMDGRLKKENIPPPTLNGQKQKGLQSTLNIEITQSCSIQAPKSTTNASLQYQQIPLKQTQAVFAGRKTSTSQHHPVTTKQGGGSTQQRRHFDFSHVQ